MRERSRPTRRSIDSAKLQITYCHITAPFSGRIGLRLVDMGNFVQAAGQTSLAVITQLQPIAVIFPVPQDDIFRVQQKFNAGEDVVVDALESRFDARNWRPASYWRSTTRSTSRPARSSSRPSFRTRTTCSFPTNS